MEADRKYFGESSWNVSKRHRNAEIDIRQIQRLGLPAVLSERELATWLEIPLSRLRWFTFDKSQDPVWHYKQYSVPKRSGLGYRKLLAPSPELKSLQRRVLRGILDKVPPSPSAHGFIHDRSIVTGARVHIGHTFIARFDLADFFPSITLPRVRGVFIDLGYPFAVAYALALLCTEYNRDAVTEGDSVTYRAVGSRYLVQGAPTSPSIANLVTRRLDRRLAGLASRYSLTYTRYADDMVFSGDGAFDLARFQAMISWIVTDERFDLNNDKTAVSRKPHRQMVTGLVVNAKVSVPREYRRRLRAILHNAQQNGLQSQNRSNRLRFEAHLRGCVDYIASVNERHGAVLRESLQQALEAESDTKIQAN